MSLGPTDVVVGAATFAAVVGVAPAIYEVAGPLGSAGDPLSALLLELLVPALLIGIIVSLGVSAARDRA